MTGIYKFPPEEKLAVGNPPEISGMTSPSAGERARVTKGLRGKDKSL